MCWVYFGLFNLVVSSMLAYFIDWESICEEEYMDFGSGKYELSMGEIFWIAVLTLAGIIGTVVLVIGGIVIGGILILSDEKRSKKKIFKKSP